MQKNFGVACYEEGAILGWLRSQPAASTEHTRVPIGYKANVLFCSHEGQKTGPSVPGYTLGLSALSAYRLGRIYPDTHRVRKASVKASVGRHFCYRCYEAKLHCAALRNGWQ